MVELDIAVVLLIVVCSFAFVVVDKELYAIVLRVDEDDMLVVILGVELVDTIVEEEDCGEGNVELGEVVMCVVVVSVLMVETVVEPV